MFGKVLDRIRKSKPDSAAEIAGALNEIEAEIPAAEQAWRQAESRYDDLILDGSEKDRDAAAEAMKAAERAWRDLDAASRKLRERHAEAKKREHRAEYEKLAETAATEVVRQIEILQEAAPHVARLLALAEEFKTCSGAISRANDAIEQSGHRDLKIRQAWARAAEAGWKGFGGPTVVPLNFPDIFLTDSAGGRFRRLIDAAELLKAAEK